jgi:CRP-like cAMP-binding protein
MTMHRSATGNRLLDLLPASELHYAQSASQSVALKHGCETYAQDDRVSFVYFPQTVVFGLVVLTAEKKVIEGASVGKEGMIGLPLFLGVDFHPSQVVAQIPGAALRMSATAFLHAARPGTVLDILLRRYTLFRLRTAKQTGACNTLHSAEARMCRCLLMMQDRSERDEFLLTHEFLSELLGLRRQTVSITAGALQRAGLVTYRRGVMRIVDRTGLQAASCECYEYMRELLVRTVGVGPAIPGGGARSLHSLHAPAIDRMRMPAQPSPVGEPVWKQPTAVARRLSNSTRRPRTGTIRLDQLVD